MTVVRPAIPRAVPTEAMSLVWPALSDMLDAYPETLGDWTKESIYAGLETGAFQLWLVGEPETSPRGALITRLVQYPRAFILQVVWACGIGLSKSVAEQVLGVLERFAQTCGADRIEVQGRFGWERYLEGASYQKRYVVLSKSIPKEMH